MQAVILAGGYGTRLSEETAVRPKPMVEIGGMPVLWHIMKIYASHGINDFIICCGYKGEMIKEYFWKYSMCTSDVTIDLRNGNEMQIHRKVTEPWKITMVDTGLKTLKGGRIRRIREYLEHDSFCLTYGDGVSDIDISKLISFHNSHDALVTLTAVQTEGRFGAFRLAGDSNEVTDFREKPTSDAAWINGGYFVVDQAAIDYVENDSTDWEHGPLEKLSHEGNLQAYKHSGFWHPMDTLNDKNALEDMWLKNIAPWKNWD
jgi:glucose-1-phosphate cytidylyltransferase